MECEIAARSDVGRVRKNNEDAFLSRPELGLFVVCDGMGGHAAGEVASNKTCEVIGNEMAKHEKLRQHFIETGSAEDGHELQKAMEQAIQLASKTVFKMAERNPEQQGMGTTCSALMIAGNKAIYGHVGDSRIFMFRDGQIHQISEDHTYVNELVKRGIITKEEAVNHPQGNVLARAVGVQPSVVVDTLVFDIGNGDYFLLCSDGLHNYYKDINELTGLVNENLEPALNNIIDTALNRGGHDNCTGILLHLKAPEKTGFINVSKRLSILKNIPLFNHLNYGELLKVLGTTQMRQVEAGTDVIIEGTQGTELFVLLSGEVDVIVGGQTVGHLTAGNHFGEMALIDKAPRSATIRTTVKSNILAMKRRDFFMLIHDEPAIATKLLWSFVQVLSGRLRTTNKELQQTKNQLVVMDELDVLFEDEE